MQYQHFQGPNFITEIPTDWFITSSPRYQVMFVGPVLSNGSRPNFSISIRPVERTVTASGVAAATRQGQETEYPQYEVLEEIDFTQTGGTGFQRRYRWFNNETNSRVVQVQTFVVVAQMLFTLTGTRADIEDAAFIDEIFDHIVQSFRIS